jgi:hypothetical protein
MTSYYQNLKSFRRKKLKDHVLHKNKIIIKNEKPLFFYSLLHQYPTWMWLMWAAETWCSMEMKPNVQNIYSCVNWTLNNNTCCIKIHNGTVSPKGFFPYLRCFSVSWVRSEFDLMWNGHYYTTKILSISVKRLHVTVNVKMSRRLRRPERVASRESKITNS